MGRSAERVLLREQLGTVRAGRGNVVILGGEAGIGKTTLARDLVWQAREGGAIVLAGACYDLTATAPYGLWLDLGERYLSHPDHDTLPPLPGPLASRRLDHVETQSGLFEAVTTFLQGIAATMTLVLVLEDVHWADPASLELLRYLGARISHLPLLVLVTYRVDELTRQNPFYRQLPSLVRESEGLRLDLGPLGRGELDALARAQYDLPDDDRERLVTHLVTVSEGNPFFAVETLRALEAQQDGGLVRDDDGWRFDRSAQTQVPPLVRQVIDARVARLGDAVRGPLTVASVIGHEVPLDLLVAVADSDEETILAAVGAAIEWHLCTESAAGARIRFVHALTREALYTGIPLGRRRALHRRVAEALEARPDGDADAIAWHYQQALDPRAPDWLTRAGDRAQRAYAWLTARDRFATAAELLEAVPGAEIRRARLLHRCGRLQRYANAPDAISSLRTAIGLATKAGDRALAADVTYSRGLVQALADEWAEGVPAMIAGVDALRALPRSAVLVTATDAAWMADALPAPEAWAASHPGFAPSGLVALDVNRHRSLAWFLAEAGRLTDALAVAAAAPHQPDAAAGPLVIGNVGHAEFGAAIARAAQGDTAGARAAFGASRRAYRAIDHHACMAFSLVTELLHVAIPCHADDPGLRRRLADGAGREIELARGAFPASVTSAIAQLPVLVLGGRWPEACAIIDACDDFGPYAMRRLRTFALMTIARHAGQPDLAWREIGRLLHDGPEAEPGSAVLLDALPLQLLAAEMSLAANDRVAAERWLVANDRWLAWSGAVLGRADNALARARWHHATGDRPLAIAATDRAVRLASSPRQPLTLSRALRLRGELTGSDEDLVGALDLATACEVPIERAQALAALGALRRDAGLVDEARRVARALDARPLIALLADSHEAGTRWHPAGLTGREVEVLRLVAEGLTDAEVAGRLTISPRTVGQHLRSVYAKLDVRSRTEATRYAIEHRMV